MEEDFNELLTNVREGGAILRGQRAPSRAFAVDVPDVNRVRSGHQMSQPEFAVMLGISV